MYIIEYDKKKSCWFLPTIFMYLLYIYILCVPCRAVADVDDAVYRPTTNSSFVSLPSSLFFFVLFPRHHQQHRHHIILSSRIRIGDWGFRCYSHSVVFRLFVGVGGNCKTLEKVCSKGNSSSMCALFSSTYTFFVVVVVAYLYFDIDEFIHLRNIIMCRINWKNQQ